VENAAMPTVSQLLKSKTLWGAAATAAVGVWQFAKPFIPPQYAPLALAVVPAVYHGVVRFVTSTALSEK
jgi:hypothetical protein